MPSPTSPPEPPSASAAAVEEGSPRSRRRRTLIKVAAELFDERPFHAVTVEMICAQAGVSGPALYRHFQSKQDLLVAVLEDPLTELFTFARTTASTQPDPRAALELMVDFHIRRVVDGYAATSIFAKNEHSAPEEARRRLRRMMRMYVEEWVIVIVALRPDLSDAQARVAAHGAFAFLNSISTFNSGLASEQLIATVYEMTLNSLLRVGLPPSGAAPH